MKVSYQVRQPMIGTATAAAGRAQLLQKGYNSRCQRGWNIIGQRLPKAATYPTPYTAVSNISECIGDPWAEGPGYRFRPQLGIRNVIPSGAESAQKATSEIS